MRLLTNDLVSGACYKRSDAREILPALLLADTVPIGISRRETIRETAQLRTAVSASIILGASLNAIRH